MTHRFDFILLSRLSVLCSIRYTSTTTHMFVICSPQIIKWWSKFIFTYKSHGLGQAKPEPSREWRLWPGLRFEEAKAGAFRPSRAGTALVLDILKFHLPAVACSINRSFHYSQRFLSTLTPIVTNIKEIWTIPTPPLAVLNDLVQAPELLSSQSVLSACTSFYHRTITDVDPSYWVQLFHL